MAQYNFMTSYGFVATSEIIRQYLGSGGTQSAFTTNFSELNKYELPAYTVYVRDSLIESYAETTKLFGFVRGTDTFEIRFGVNRMTSTSNGYYRYVLAVTFFKNGVRATSFNMSSALTSLKEIQFSSVISKPFTHFYLTYATQTANYNNTNCLIYDYNVTTINNYGSNISVSKGAFTIGFCTSNFLTTNTYNNCYPNPSSNNIRNVSVVFSVNSNQSSYLTQLNDYDTFIEYCLGKSVKYVGDDDISTSGGGFGTGQETSDTTEIPDTSDITDFNPTYDIANSTAFFTHYIMSISNLQSLATHLYDSSFINQINYMFKDRPLSCIVSLRRLPFQVSSDGTKNIYLGDVDTEISASVCKHSYQTVDCGTITIPEVWGSSLDYNPYTKISLVLPFARTVSLNVDDVMNGEIRVKYIVDILSGDFVVFVLVNQNAKTNVLYSYTGNCAIAYPLSAEDYTQRMLAGFNLLSSVAVGGMTGGMTGIVKGGINSVGNVISAKNVHEHSGSYNGNTGFMGILKPYAIIHRPIQSLPDKIENYKGFPSNIVATLSSLSGYTEVEDINLSVTATESEKKMIVNLLKEGVII